MLLRRYHKKKEEQPKEVAPNYDEMKVEQLKEVAKDKGIQGHSAMKRDELLQKLKVEQR
jgi:hypothetical protein